MFYPTLAACGLTPRLLKPEEFPELIRYRIGLTDMAKFAFGMDKDICKNDYDIKKFEEKILLYQPGLVCFNGKNAAAVYLQLKSTAHVPYGLNSQLIGKTKIFVAPSTSRAGQKYWDESIWRQLQKYIQH